MYCLDSLDEERGSKTLQTLQFLIKNLQSVSLDLSTPGKPFNLSWNSKILKLPLQHLDRFTANL